MIKKDDPPISLAGWVYLYLFTLGAIAIAMSVIWFTHSYWRRQNDLIEMKIKADQRTTVFESPEGRLEIKGD